MRRHHLVDNDEANSDKEHLSKTRQKKEMNRLQSLGEELVMLKKEQLQKIELPDDLFNAILEAQRLMSAREAKRRQLQYIGRLMRRIDPDPIQQKLAWQRGESNAVQAWLHQIEHLRDRLLADEKVLGEIKRDYPSADLNQLRQLRRNAIKETEQNSPPKNRRALFQTLKTLLTVDKTSTVEHDEAVKTHSDSFTNEDKTSQK